MITPETTLEDLAFIVCTGLKKHNIDAVLTGGAAVSIYTRNKYQSYDLDFVSYRSHKEISEAMKSMGFEPRNRYFVHPNTHFFVEFPPAPLSLGSEFVNKWNQISKGERLLQILSPTQSVKDRLAAYFHWNDLECLNQAVWICQSQSVDFNDLENWAWQEGSPEKFKKFLAKTQS